MKEFQVIRTNQDSQHFQALVEELNAYLRITDGDEFDFYYQYNGIEALDNVVVLMVDGIAAACGAFKPYDEDAVELKRMFTSESFRRQGLSARVLRELEAWALELGYTHTVLETGLKQIAAVKMYENLGFNRIPNYGQYEGMPNSLCYKKKLNASIRIKD